MSPPNSSSIEKVKSSTDTMGSSTTPGAYQFDVDRLTKQRIPQWLSEAIVRIICSLAITSLDENGAETFAMSPSDYLDVRDIMAALGWYVRRTVIWHAYSKFLRLDIDEVLAVGSTVGKRTELIPDRIKRLVKYIQIKNKSSDRPGKFDEELADIVRLTTKPTVLARHLDTMSLEHSGSVNRAIRIASRVHSEDNEENDRSAELEVQIWAALKSSARQELEQGWLRQAINEAAAAKAVQKAKKVEEQVKEFEALLQSGDSDDNKKGSDQTKRSSWLSQVHKYIKTYNQDAPEKLGAKTDRKSCLKQSREIKSSKTVRWRDAQE